MGGLKSKKLFLTDLEAGKSKIEAQEDPVSGESSYPGSSMAIFLLSPHIVEGARDLSGVSFIRPLIPFMKAPSS